jgi:predicted 3-demethylubiquinone-9 3-methyltransferase (glyoxalase superfamily)
MQKIVPFLWFDHQAEEAVALYTSLFEGSEVPAARRYGEAGPGPRGSVMSLTARLGDLQITALNGGPQFHFTPAVSFFVTCGTESEIDRLWRGLLPDGKVLMELSSYPFSRRFGWLSDRYGVSWQLNLASGPTRITPFFFFVGPQAGKAEEAMKHWGSLFEPSGIDQLERYPAGGGKDAGTVMHGRFRLAGQEFMAMDSAREHAFSFTPALSMFVNCDTQEEVDRLWDRVSAGGEKGRCGWLTDRYGVSWQIVPSVLGSLLGDPDPARSRRVMEAMLRMDKLDIRELQRAHGT